MNRFLVVALTLTASAFAQSFDVATIKKAEEFQPGKPMAFGRRGGPGTSDPGRITWSQANLRTLLATAYDVRSYQITGPDWLDSERFDIVAKVPAGATKEQVNLMWQDLLADRFGVKLHHTSKVFPAYEISAAKSGVKLKQTTLDPKAAADQSAAEPEGFALPPPPPPGAPPPGGMIAGRGPGPGGPAPFPGAPQLDKNGVPQLKNPGIFMMMTMGPNGPTAHLVAKAATIAELASRLSDQMNQPIVDKTGLTAKYDFTVEFTPDFGGRGPMPGAPGPPPGAETPNSSDPGGTTLTAALQQQLGLRLVSTKTPLDVLVIDKAEKTPTEN